MYKWVLSDIVEALWQHACVKNYSWLLVSIVKNKPELK